ncbi:MAG: hypothetical protein ACFCGT_02425 [Sandaracinaceae bacterium]
MKILLAPDVYVNASVAGQGLAPEQVVNRVLGGEARAKTTPWILERVEAMLHLHPNFREEAVEPQLEIIRQRTDLVESEGTHGPDAWTEALVAGAKAAGVERVVTDHPDLADQDEVEGIEFLSSDAWLIEQITPPPPPPTIPPPGTEDQAE